MAAWMGFGEGAGTYVSKCAAVRRGLHRTTHTRASSQAGKTPPTQRAQTIDRIPPHDTTARSTHLGPLQHNDAAALEQRHHGDDQEEGGKHQVLNPLRHRLRHGIIESYRRWSVAVLLLLLLRSLLVDRIEGAVPVP